MKKVMKGLLWLFDHFEEIVASVLLGVTFIAFGLQIIFRFLSIPASVYSEIYQYAFLVALMFGISYANKQDEHIRADILTSHLGPKGKLVCSLLSDLITILFSIGLAHYGNKLVKTMIRFPQYLPLMKISYAIIYSILPLTSILACFRVIQHRVLWFRKNKDNSALAVEK